MTAPPEAEIEQRVRESGLLAAGRPVVVLLSGGRDSTCLLDLAVAITGRESVIALHLNYGLRDGADADERHCAELCSRLEVALEVQRPSRRERGTLQAWARDERYATAARIALATGGDVAAGHTATDQVETILYRLASSPSRRALLGMRPREGLLVRPLLEFTRAQTAAFCTARGLTWREDESNDSDAYARNRIRAQLVPALEAVHPAAADNVIAVAEILREEAAVLDSLVDEVLERRDRVRLARLREVEPALARLVVQRLADDAAGGPASGVARRAAEILALDEHGTVQLDTGGGVVAIAEYGMLRFESRASRSTTTTPEPVLLAIPGSAVFGEQQITCELGPPAREPGVLDRATLGDDLLVRSWRPGDRMAPLGLQGSKSLQDLFTARRVPRRERGGVPVVESGGEIVWVAGVATSEHFKVTDSTAEAVRLSVRPEQPPRS